jgi:hypothetical protein
MADFNAFMYAGLYDGTTYLNASFSPVAFMMTTDNETAGAGSTTYELGDTIDLNPIIFGHTSVTYVGHSSDGFLGQSTLNGTFLFFTNEPLQWGDTVPITVDAFVVCFLTGVQIATTKGERAVETLAVGDLVLTANGEARPVRWIGRQSIMSLFANPIRNYPIRIAAGALGAGLPKRDLFLSPDHALLVDGVLVQAGALVNGTSITRVADPGERFTYWHIETEDHALVLAEGAPAETFVDNVTRRRFDNYAEYEALYGGESVVAELDLPRAMSARQVPLATRQRLAAVALELGYVTMAAA